jgi:hypothetical protein
MRNRKEVSPPMAKKKAAKKSVKRKKATKGRKRH